MTQFPTVIDDQIDFIDCTGTRYNVTPLIIAAGKGSFEKTKILLVHGANPNKQCTTGDTALNLAVHRQKYHIVNLLLQYRANPNLYNQAGKTALHRAVASYSNENAKQIQALLNNGADLYIEDRNQRIPLDEAVVTNKPDIIDLLISYDRGLLQYSYRAAIIASRLGYDKCLEVLLNYGLNPNISDQTNITPLHVAVRSLKPSTARLLLANGANPNIVNNRGETPITIAEFLQPNQKQEFLSILTQNSSVIPSDYQSTNPISYVCPLLQNRSNWTLNSDEFRSPTATNSSVENLLDPTTDTVWCSTQSRGAWVIFDFKHQYNLTGIRIIGCDNHSTPRNGHLDVSNALNGPWLQVKTFTCAFGQGNKTDVFFPSLTTRFIRVFILDNYGGDDIRIQCIGFFGVDTRLINLLQEYRLENSLNTLLANGINDQESLYENQDEILNSSDKYLHVNDHFQFIHLIESLKTPQLTYLEWFVPPQTTAIAGEKFHTFSVTADEDLTDRVKLEEQLENSPQSNVVLMKDLEPIQGHSLVDFSDYVIKQPGRYKIRVVSVESPHIHTTWQEIAVGKKPLEISVRTPDRSNSYTPGIIPPKLPSTPTTDITDETADGEIFDKPQNFRQTPDPYLGESRDEDDDDDDNSDSMTEIRQHNRDRSMQRQLESKSFRDYGTQMDDKGTRTIGTMSEPIKTRNSGNETQPQSSSTQTLTRHREHEEDDYQPRSLDRRNHYPRASSRSPPRRDDYHNEDRYTNRTDVYHPRSKSHRPYTSSKEVHHTPPPPVQYRTPSPSSRHRYPSSQRSRSPSSSQHRSRPTERYHSPSLSKYYLKSSSHRPRSPSPPADYRPTTSYRSRDRPQMVSAETDTKLDGMKPTENRGTQPDPTPTTRDCGVVTSAEKVYPKENPINSKHEDFTLTSPNVVKRRSYRDDQPPSSSKNYRLRPESTDSCTNNYERLAGKDDEGNSFDENRNSRQHTPKSTIDNRQRPRTSFIAPFSDDNDEYIKELPRGGSISFPSSNVTQPDTLPRSYKSPVRQPQPAKQHDNTLHQGRQQAATPKDDSMVYNIGTQNVLHQSPTNEFATPFKIRYVQDDDDFSLNNNQIRSSTLKRDELRSRANQIVLLPVINSSRTYVFEKQSIPANHLRQSRTNGNFYLATSPTLRSLNSSFQDDEYENDPLKEIIESDHFNGHTLRSQVA